MIGRIPISAQREILVNPVRQLPIPANNLSIFGARPGYLPLPPSLLVYTNAFHQP